MFTFLRIVGKTPYEESKLDSDDDDDDDDDIDENLSWSLQRRKAKSVPRIKVEGKQNGVKVCWGI